MPCESNKLEIYVRSMNYSIMFLIEESQICFPLILGRSVEYRDLDLGHK